MATSVANDKDEDQSANDDEIISKVDTKPCFHSYFGGVPSRTGKDQNLGHFLEACSPKEPTQAQREAEILLMHAECIHLP